MDRLTIKDIARMAGVSHTTVSRALNGARNIRPETYARIMEICRDTGYTLNAAARQLKRSDSGAIGIIVPDISNAFFCELTRHLEWLARQKGRNVFISSSFYDYAIEDKNIRALMENRVSGIILSGVGDQTYLRLRDYLGKVPIVFLGDNIPAGMVSQIAVDNYAGTLMAVEYLLSLGHRDLVFLGLIFLLIKRDRLSVRFGMLWLIFGGVWLIFAAVPWLLKVLRGVFRFQVVSNMVFTMLLAFVLLVLLTLSVAASLAARRLRQLAQSNALLEERVRRLEQQLKTGCGPDSDA